MSSGTTHGGFVLLESLVALTVLSLGLAGSAVLLVQTLRQQREAAYRSDALQQAVSLTELLRSLRRIDRLPLQAVTAPGDTPDCPVTPADCDIERAARREIGRWRTATAALLPSDSEATVAVLDASAPAYVVAIAWTVPGGSPSRLRLAVEP